MKKLLTLCLAISTFTFAITPTTILANNNINEHSLSDNSTVKKVDFVFFDGELIPLVSNEDISMSNLVHANTSERVVIGTYSLSKSQVRDLADNIKLLPSNYWSLGEFLVGLINPSIALVSYVSSLFRNVIFGADVVKAPKFEKRLRVTITDYKDYHTFYSVQVTYKIIS